MIDLGRIEALFAPQCAGADDDPSCCPRCSSGVCIDSDAAEWSAVDGDYCDTCEREIARQARTDVPALVAELRAARAEVERLRTAAADERKRVAAWLCGRARRLRETPLRRGDRTRGEALAEAAGLIAAGEHDPVGRYEGAAKGGE